jgi:restriction endonuclease S subunit
MLMDKKNLTETDIITKYILRIESGMNGRYISLYLNTSVTAKYLGKTKLKLVQIPLPALNEQKCIVKKVTQLLQLCDTLKQNLKTQQTTTNRLADTIGMNLAK